LTSVQHSACSVWTDHHAMAAPVNRRSEASMASIVDELSGRMSRIKSQHSIITRMESTMERSSSEYLRFCVANLEQDIQAESGGVQGSKCSFTKMLGSLMVVSMPMVLAMNNLGFAWAQSVSSFSPTTPLILVNVIWSSFSFVLLCHQYGWAEAKLLLTSRLTFCGMLVPGVLCGACNCMRYVALLHLSPDIVTVLCQFGVLFLVPVQLILLNKLPTVPQLFSLASTSMIATSYSINRSSANSGSPSQVSLLGVLITFVHLVLYALGFTVFEFLVLKCKSNADNKDAEQQRCLVAEGFWAMIINICLAFAFDGSNIVDKGLFYGWGWQTVVGSVAPYILLKVFGNLITLMYGSFIRTLANCVELVVIYPLQIVILGNTKFEVSNLVLLVGLAASAVNFSVISRAIKNEKVRTLMRLHGELTADPSSAIYETKEPGKARQVVEEGTSIMAAVGDTSLRDAPSTLMSDIFKPKESSPEIIGHSSSAAFTSGSPQSSKGGRLTAQSFVCCPWRFHRSSAGSKFLA